jgi:hypothetical protein
MAQFRPEYEYCDTLTTFPEQQECEQKVDKLVAEAKEMCFPQPPTCFDEAERFYDEQKELCHNSTTD